MFISPLLWEVKGEAVLKGKRGLSSVTPSAGLSLVFLQESNDDGQSCTMGHRLAEVEVMQAAESRLRGIWSKGAAFRGNGKGAVVSSAESSQNSYNLSAQLDKIVTAVFV